MPIPDTLVDQVIGQEDAAIVIRKAAEQRRHMLMIGDPGTGKSMLAKAMTELMPSESLEDTMCYMNDDDENEPRIRTVPAGRGDRIVKDRREQLREQRERTSRTLMFVALLIGAALLIATLQSGEIITLLFGLFILAFGYMFIKNRLVSNDESRIPKLLVKRKRGDMPPSSMPPAHSRVAYWVMFVTIHFSRVGWKLQPMSESKPVRFTRRMVEFCLLTKLTYYDCKNNKHC